MLELSEAFESALHEGEVRRGEGGHLSMSGDHRQVLGNSYDLKAAAIASQPYPQWYLKRNLPVHRTHRDLRMANACIGLFDHAVLVLAACGGHNTCSPEVLEKLLTALTPAVLIELDPTNRAGAKKGVITKEAEELADAFQQEITAGAVRLDGSQLANVLGEEAIGIIHPVFMKLMGDREFVRAYSRALGAMRHPRRVGDRAPSHGWILSEVFHSGVWSESYSVPLLLASCLALGASSRLVLRTFLDKDYSDLQQQLDPDSVVDASAGSLVVLDYLAGLVSSAMGARAIDTLSLPYSPRGKRVIRSTNGISANFEYDVIVRDMEVSVFRSDDEAEALALSTKLKAGVRSTVSIREAEFTTLVGGSGVGKSTRVAEILEALVDHRDMVQSQINRKVNIFFADTSEPSSVMVMDSNDPVIPVTNSPMARVWNLVRKGEVVPLHGLKPFGADLMEMLSVLENSGVVEEGDLSVLILDSASDLVDEAQMVNPDLRSGSRTGGRDSAIRKVFQQQTNALARGGWAILQTVNLQSMPGQRDQANDFAFTYSISGGSDVTALLLGGNEVPFIRDRSAGALYVDEKLLGVTTDPSGAMRHPDAVAGTYTRTVVKSVN